MIVEILESLWPRNKAKGLLAQTLFTQEITKGIFGPDAVEKLMPGCWLLAPKELDFYKFRFCFFTHPNVMKSSDVADRSPKTILGERYRPFHAIAEFMENAGVGVVYTILSTESGDLPLNEIKDRSFENVAWNFFGFQNSAFVLREPYEFFGKWGGGRGRPGPISQWDPLTKEKMGLLSDEILAELLLNEIFYTGFVKIVLRKSVNDPYDVDSFLVSLSQKHIFPMEIKEKFPGQTGRDKFFGIDAGRIMMLLRLCLPNDANAVYLIRELDETGQFIGWKYITLSDIIMTASWNLQAGGPGMGGQSTQTVRLPYDYFKDFTADEISEDSLKNIGSFPEDIKSIATRFGVEIESRFNQ